MSKGMRTVVLALMLTFGLHSGNMAVADPVTFLFTGNVTSVSSVLSGTFDTTQSMSGSYTFESTLVGTFPFPNIADYSPLIAFDITIGGYTANQAGAGGLIRVGNDFGPLIVDKISIGGNVSGPNVDGFAPNVFEIFLRDFAATAFDSLALPLNPPDLSSFSGSFGGNDDNREWLFFFFDNFFEFGEVRGDITSLSLQAEPIPAPELSGISYGLPNFGWILSLGGGLLGLVVIRRRYSRGSTV